MSTNCTISMLTKNDKIRTIYCHHDGYTRHMMPILTQYYNTYEKVEALLNLGNLSFLDASIDCPPGHTYRTPVDGYTIAYARDRGQKKQSARLYYKWKEKEEEQYNYLFIHNTWTCDKKEE